MVVTEVRAKRGGRFAVYIDGALRFEADGRTAEEFGLRGGAELTEEELRRAEDAARGRFAVDKAMTLLTYRDHSSAELRGKLRARVGDEAAGEAVGRMQELGLVNDGAFARNYAEELLERRLYGAARVKYELARKGISKERAEETVAELDTDPQGRILRLLRKKYPRGIPNDEARRRAEGQLSRAGFAWDDIRAALREYGAHTEDDWV